MKTSFKKGDEVRIISSLTKVYFRYSTWTYLDKWRDNFTEDSLPSKNKIYEIILVGKHDYDNRLLALVQDKDTKQVFIVGVDDLELIKESDI